MDTNCLFCKIVAGEIPAERVWEDEKWLAIMDIKPINLGHTLLIPKAHYQNLFDLPTDLLTELGGHLQKLAGAIKVATQADGLNIGMNNEGAAGQLIMHTHLHLIPRFESDGLKHWPGQEVTAEQLKKMGEKIKNNL